MLLFEYCIYCIDFLFCAPIFRFYRIARDIDIAILSVCPSVRLSVTFQY